MAIKKNKEPLSESSYTDGCAILSFFKLTMMEGDSSNGNLLQKVNTQLLRTAQLNQAWFMDGPSGVCINQNQFPGTYATRI